MAAITFTKNVSDELRIELSRYINFSAYELMPESIADELEINVIYASGGCFDAYVEVDDLDFGEEDPRTFNIHIDESVDDVKSLLLTICHEMVHVKQYAMNELAEAETNARMSCLWNGALYMSSGSKADYYNSPWEVEAYGKENGLYWACKEYYKAIEHLMEIK